MLTVDVFAERPLEGNPLAVFPDASGYSDRLMQDLAREMNLSETTFVSGRVADGSWRVRIFTPTQEFPFAGHPTLGTAWVIRNLLSEGAPDTVTLALKVGKVPVRFEPDRPESAGASGAAGAPEDAIPWLTAPAVTLGDTVSHDAMAAALRLELADLDPELPVQYATVGLSTSIVPLRSRTALMRCRPDLDAFAAAGIPVHTYVFCREPRDPGHELSARFFFEAGGVREDPATGSATASFGRYALEHGFLGDHFRVRIGQGHEIRRPSLLHLEARWENGEAVIEVGGRVMPVSKGTLFANVR